MSDDFEITVPTQLHIRTCYVVPYVSVTRVRQKKSASSIYDRVLVWAQLAKNNRAVELVFPGNRWNDLDNSKLSNPSNKIAVFFVAGRNCEKTMGTPAGTEMFVINDAIYRRMTWGSVGEYGRRKGMVAKTKETFSYFLERLWQPEPALSSLLASLASSALKSAGRAR